MEPATESPLLLPANEHKQLIVIDFEYSSANTRGLEFANHFVSPLTQLPIPTDANCNRPSGATTTTTKSAHGLATTATTRHRSSSTISCRPTLPTDLLAPADLFHLYPRRLFALALLLRLHHWTWTMCQKDPAHGFHKMSSLRRLNLTQRCDSSCSRPGCGGR